MEGRKILNVVAGGALLAILGLLVFVVQDPLTTEGGGEQDIASNMVASSVPKRPAKPARNPDDVAFGPPRGQAPREDGAESTTTVAPSGGGGAKPVNPTPSLSKKDAPPVYTKQEYLAASRTISHSHTSAPFEPLRPDECAGPEPPADYPRLWPVMDLLTNWPADDPDIPPTHYDSLCRFDYADESQREIALAFRDAQVPFIAQNIPMMNEAVPRWSDPNFLAKKFKDKPAGRVEMSANNHFMYFNKKMAKRYADKGGDLSDFAHPDVAKLTFDHWLHLAVDGANASDYDQHYYFLTDSKESPWLLDELPMFKENAGKSLFMAEPKETHGIFCRFGMRGCIAENHYDGARNMVAVLGGQRRYMISPPETCEYAYLLPSKHPSGRHSEIDWSEPDLDSYPDFPKLLAMETILQEGDILYIPTYWFHYIISLDTNWQCNCRSGISAQGSTAIKKCGFRVKGPTDNTDDSRA